VSILPVAALCPLIRVLQAFGIDASLLFDRFEKNDILRVVRALAIVRPSLIALQMPLSEEDEVFVEKCFQRSLLVSVTEKIHFKCDPCGLALLLQTAHHVFPPLQELEKLISFSGTPTCVWRRTGEICLVGDEFCLLTEWSKDELLDPHESSISDESASSTDEHAAIVGCRNKFIYEVSSNIQNPQNLLFQIRSPPF
jgi:hypothetical protein